MTVSHEERAIRSLSDEKRTTMPILDRRVIRCGDPDIRNGLPRVFGALVVLAGPIVHMYHGDLFHDALWLDKHTTGREFTFTWSAGEAGTCIGANEDDVRKAADTLGHRLICRVAVALDERDRTVLTVEHFGLVIPNREG